MRRWLVSLGLLAVLLGVMAASEKAPAAMATAATRFLSGLTPELRQQATFAFDAEERLNWHYIPRERKGVPIKAMSEDQRKLARELLKAGLSDRGYLTASSIMDLETILGDLERGRGGKIVRDPELYFFSVFGTPSPREPWGWRVEGHHVALNFTVVNGELIATSPSFFGSNPAEVKEGPQQGLRILHAEEDLARELLKSLTDEQRKTATLDAKAPNDIVTMNSKKADPLSPSGLAAAQMTGPQRTMLKKVLDEYAGQMTTDLAGDRMDKIQKAGLEKVFFAWAGEADRGQPHYYRIQGPTFLIEFDNTQNNANHIHSVWRDFDGDFGRDLLREHIRSVAHE